MKSAQYSSEWEQFAQSSAELMKMKTRMTLVKPARELEQMNKDFDRIYFGQEVNKAFTEEFEETLNKESIKAGEIDELFKRLEENIKFNLGLKIRDLKYRAWLEAHYELLRERINAKAMEILRIEPTISIGEGSAVKVAIVEIGERIHTIRYPERNRWREFFRKVGFAVEPVFLPAFLVGDVVSADAIRMAAAHVGAGAVLAYTTTTETDVGPLRESIAVLAFAKCLFIDTRTEYLYFNAEGEGKDKQITLPGMIDIEGFERGVIESALEGLRGEILHELERLRAEN
jgi:hypothetical protein